MSTWRGTALRRGFFSRARGRSWMRVAARDTGPRNWRSRAQRFWGSMFRRKLLRTPGVITRAREHPLRAGVLQAIPAEDEAFRLDHGVRSDRTSGRLARIFAGNSAGSGPTRESFWCRHPTGCITRSRGRRRVRIRFMFTSSPKRSSGRNSGWFSACEDTAAESRGGDCVFGRGNGGCRTRDQRQQSDPTARISFWRCAGSSRCHTSRALSSSRRAGNVLQTRERHIALLDGEILKKNQWIEREQIERAEDARQGSGDGSRTGRA